MHMLTYIIMHYVKALCTCKYIIYYNALVCFQVNFEGFDETIETTKRQKKMKEVTSHVAIHTLHTDGLRELYRHFLVLPDGAIVEVILLLLFSVFGPRI